MIWPIALRVASRGGRPLLAHDALDVLDTTMASSTTMPIASTMANRVSTLIE
jgi:hypothetical protein